MTFFYGFDAYVGAIISATRVKFWAADPSGTPKGFDPAQLIDVDLAANPEACRRGTITQDKLQADDFAGFKLGGYTTIGPDYPNGKTVGGCWLSDTYWGALPPAIQPPRVPAWRQCFAYEMTTYYDWATHRRYYGFYAQILASNSAGTAGLTSIWPAGRSQVPGTAPSGTIWIDYTSSVHPVAPNLTAIWPGTGVLQGALFLDVAAIKLMPFDDGGSKHPFYLGSDPVFED